MNTEQERLKKRRLKAAARMELTPLQLARLEEKRRVKADNQRLKDKRRAEDAKQAAWLAHEQLRETLPEKPEFNYTRTVMFGAIVLVATFLYWWSHADQDKSREVSGVEEVSAQQQASIGANYSDTMRETLQAVQLQEESKTSGVGVRLVEEPEVILANESKGLDREAKPPKQYQALWKDQKWKNCVAEFKSKANKPNIYRYIKGRCGVLDGQLHQLEEGDCYMKIIPPSKIRNAKGYETNLVCVGEYGLEERVCSDRKNYYNEAIEERMALDERCVGFPNLVSKVVTANNPGYSPKELEQIKKHEHSGKYEDLPLSIRDSNRNADLKCREQVAKVRRLENHPQFESDKSIRFQWQEQFEYAVNLGCTL